MDTVIQQDIDQIITSFGDGFKLLRGKTVVITGANGVVGAYFVHTIARLNETLCKTNPITCVCLTKHKVATSSRLGYLLKNKNIEFKTVDVSVKIPTITHIDYIIHCASYGSPKAYLAKPIETMDANTVATKHLLEVARKNRNCKFMFISSAAIYGEGRIGEKPFTEHHSGYVSPIEMRAIYSESKRYGETLCMVYATHFNVHTTIARLSSMFGPGFSLDDGRAIPDFFSQAFNTSTINIHGDPKITRAYIYISDAIEGMFRIMIFGKKGEAYNIASEKVHTMKYIAETICSFFPSCSLQFRKEDKKSYLRGSPLCTVASSQKLRTTLDWKQKIKLKEALHRTYLWYNNQETEGA